jgi:peptidoglycan-associated lipoprotein
MSRASSAPIVLLAVAALVSACHRRPPATEAPQPSASAEQARRDSIARAEQARRDSLARTQAAADSARQARERAASEARQLVSASIYFDFDKSDLRADARSTLDAKLPILRANPALRIRIEGNCDERGSATYNMALGERRAAAAKRYLTDYGVDPGRIDIISYGSERPQAPGHNEAAWAQNRRDDFVIVAGGEQITSKG